CQRGDSLWIEDTILQVAVDRHASLHRRNSSTTGSALRATKCVALPTEHREPDHACAQARPVRSDALCLAKGAQSAGGARGLAPPGGRQPAEYGNTPAPLLGRKSDSTWPSP